MDMYGITYFITNEGIYPCERSVLTLFLRSVFHSIHSVSHLKITSVEVAQQNLNLRISLQKTPLC